MNAVLASLAATNGNSVFDTIPTPDLVEGLPAAEPGACTRQRCETIAVQGKTVFASYEALNYARLDQFAAPGVLNISDVKGQKEYHADL
jgi:hypothetical protein